MSDWPEGFVSGIDYTYGFYRELTPQILRFALALQGVRPPALEGGFAWCELGIGQGVTANLLAAANPGGEFWGTDVDPGHAAGARQLAQAAGLANTHWFGDSFAEFLERDTPEFDFICLHGVYSWVSHEDRGTLVELVHRKLKVGGAVYVGYNCLPGWTQLMPLRHLLTAHAHLMSAPADPPASRIERALAFAEDLASHKAGYFRAMPVAARHLAHLRTESANYLAHEYFVPDWNPLYFSEVAKEMAAAKLTYATSADLLERIPAMHYPPAVAKKLAAIADPILRETARDFCTQSAFRRDIFVKGARPLSAEERGELIGGTPLVLQVPRQAATLTVKGHLGESRLRPEVYDPLLDALAERPWTIRELLGHPDAKRIGLAGLVEAATVMIGAGHVQPGREPDGLAARRESTRRFNQAVLDLARHANRITHLASPLTGSGIDVPRFTQLFLLARTQGRVTPAEWAEFAWDALRRQGQLIVKEGKTLASPEDNQRELVEQAERLARTGLATLIRLGIAEG